MSSSTCVQTCVLGCLAYRVGGLGTAPGQFAVDAACSWERHLHAGDSSLCKSPIRWGCGSVCADICSSSTLPEGIVGTLAAMIKQSASVRCV
jgi:hypothetical protein